VLDAIPKRRAYLRQRVSIAMQKTSLPPRVTVREIVRCTRRSMDTGGRRTGDRQGGLEEKAGAKLQTLSAVSCSAHRRPRDDRPARARLMDEPTSELDPQGRRYVWDIVREKIADRRTTFLLTTHMMDEAQRLCTASRSSTTAASLRSARPTS